MGTHISGGSATSAAAFTAKPIVELDNIITALGSTKTTLFPFWEATDDLVRSYKENYHTLVPTSSGPGFDPLRHPGGVNSYLFDPDNSMYLLGEDATDYDMGDGSTDEVFSVGLWILPYDISNVTLMAKYDTNLQRTWRMYLDGTGNIVFDQFDESADTTEIGTSTSTVTANQWTMITWTYDGGETAPVIAFYQNDVADATVSTVESGAYVAMENNTAALTLGADLATDAPQQLFNGRIALPFICGKQLTTANVTTIYNAGRVLLGI